MNEKVNIQSLSEQLSKRHGLSKDSADDFVREFFNLITEGLEKDHLVKIKGLGTFKVIDVEDRESVDVNTKERIVIKGHSKVTFTPEATLKEAINKPFEAFETTILDEDTPLEAMTYIPKEDDTLRTIQELYGKVTDEEPDKAKTEEIIAVLPEETPNVDAQISDEMPDEPSEDDSEPSSDNTGQDTDAPLLSESPVEATQADLQMQEEDDAAAESSLMDAIAPVVEIPTEPAGPDHLMQPEEGLDAIKAPVEDNAAILENEIAENPVEAGKDVSSESSVKALEADMLPSAAMEPLKENKPESAKIKEEQSSSKSLKVFSWIILLLILLCGAFVASLYMDDIKGWLNSGGKTAESVSALQMEKPAAAMETATAISQAADSVKTEGASQDASALPTPETPDKTTAAEKPSGAQVNPDQIRTSEVKVPATTSSKAASSSQPSTESKTATSTAAPAKNNAVASTAKTTTTGSSASTTQKLQEGVSYRIDGTLTTHVVKSGETLRSIALKYYGSKSFSGYIAEHNAKIIKNPDNVPAGSKINIPKLVKK